MTDQNARFLAYLKKLGEQPAGFVAIHFHVSHLPAAKRSRSHLSAGFAALTPIKGKAKESEIFLLPNMDIVAIGRDVPRATLAGIGMAVQNAFFGTTSPNIVNAYGDIGEFFTLFDLSSEYAKLLGWAERNAGLGELAPGADPAAPPGDAKKEVDWTTIAHIKEGLPRTDISSMVFAQPVYFIGEPGKTTVVFRENYIGVQLLEKTFCPGLSLTSKHWLFNDLTEDLDLAVLRFLSNTDERASRRRISINLNLSTVASDRFGKFDAELTPDQRSNITIEINKTDMFENPRVFLKVVPLLRDRGYRVLLDSLHFEAIEFVDFDTIPCDFAKLFWSADIMRLGSDRFARLQAKVGRHEQPHFLLARCDTAESLRFARSAGIQMVQGRLVDNMVKRNIPI